MRGNLITLLLAIVPSCLAQDGAGIRKASTTSEMPWVAGCPVGVDARQSPLPPRILISTAQPALHPAYSVSLRPFDSRVIREASIKLIGTIGGRVMQVGEEAAASTGAESFTLANVSNVKISTKSLTAVQWIELVSVTCTDGTVWHRDRTTACRMAPSGILPVSN